jgi:hypothetical protein
MWYLVILNDCPMRIVYGWKSLVVEATQCFLSGGTAETRRAAVELFDWAPAITYLYGGC